ncbi:zinc finger protein 250-like isoform X14 [Cydia strobilella]|uniref:zinc finger protein 250-like isoform X14 n=1 Tax=Cydia strobilella TaxID=1100964 RepID=UPI0030045091
MMETPNTLNSGMCRCCSSEGTFKDIKTQYHWMGEEEVYAEMLTDCFDIKIQTPEDMDNGICEVCITQLRNAVNFKKQVLHTEEQFKRRLQGRDVKNPIKIESAEDPIDSDHLSDPDFTEEYEVPIKQELEEKPKAKKRQAKSATPRAKKAKTDAESSQRVARRTRIITIDATNQKAGIKLAISPNVLRLPKGGPSETRKNLHNLGQILLNSNASPIKAHDLRGYMCAFCPKRFPQPQKLKKHFLEEHNDDKLIRRMSGSPLSTHVVKLDITLLNCALCDTDFDTLEDFILHLVEGHNKKLYTDVRNQLLPFKFDTPELCCAICSVTYGSFKLLQQHMNAHFRNYICKICNAGFVVERLLAHHIRRHGDEKVECSECGKTFINTLKMREHVKRVHMGLDKRNKCQFCEEKFVDYWKKVDHMVKEHGVPSVVLSCGACERTFANQRALARHTKKDHLMERKHKCSYCEMKFFSSSALKKHLPKHTGIKNFKCEVCSKEYGRKTTLREHMRIHTDDRRFSCAHCGLAFIQKCSLKGHLRSKHGEIV